MLTNSQPQRSEERWSCRGRCGQPLASSWAPAPTLRSKIPAKSRGACNLDRLCFLRCRCCAAFSSALVSSRLSTPPLGQGYHVYSARANSQNNLLTFHRVSTLVHQEGQIPPGLSLFGPPAKLRAPSCPRLVLHPCSTPSRGVYRRRKEQLPHALWPALHHSARPPRNACFVHCYVGSAALRCVLLRVDCVPF